MEKQALAIGEKREAVVAAGTASKPKEVFKRMGKAISTNMGLYEIRMNLFLWGLFKMGRQKES